MPRTTPLSPTQARALRPHVRALTEAEANAATYAAWHARAVARRTEARGDLAAVMQEIGLPDPGDAAVAFVKDDEGRPFVRIGEFNPLALTTDQVTLLRPLLDTDRRAARELTRTGTLTATDGSAPRRDALRATCRALGVAEPGDDPVRLVEDDQGARLVEGEAEEGGAR